MHRNKHYLEHAVEPGFDTCRDIDAPWPSSGSKENGHIAHPHLATELEKPSTWISVYLLTS
jgi:hypothetical protein